jgi:uncharacterized membrane protein
MLQNWYDMMTKNRMEAFSDGMFAIILTILVLELHVPRLDDNSLPIFLHALGTIAPKLISFFFSFFIIAIFWINHHHFLHQIKTVDVKFLWLNIALLFFTCLFPFLTAFIGDYPMNPFVVALFPLNMSICSIVLGAFWKHAFVDTTLAPNNLTDHQKRSRIRQDRAAALINLISAALAFIWVPISLAIIMLMQLLFVGPEFLSKRVEIKN